MNKLILAGAAAMALAIPAAGTAQTNTVDDKRAEMTDMQRTAYDAWPAERRTMYDAWPNTYRTYYWELTPAQQNGWWALTDEQRTRVYAMTPEQRTAAWTTITQQMNSAGNMNNASTTGTTARTAAAMASTGGPRFVRGEVVQTTPAGYSATANGADLPVCTPNQQDGCINSWEKNKTGTRPLNYWPGQPASEMPGKKPNM